MADEEKKPDQIDLNLKVYVETYKKCKEAATQLLVDENVFVGVNDPLHGEIRELTQFLFERFWNDQFEIKKASATTAPMEFLGNLLEKRMG
jgi:hypothetical protein